MNLDYIAGFFDGEGWCSIHFRNPIGTGRYGTTVLLTVALTQGYEHAAILRSVQRELRLGRIYKKRNCAVLQIYRKHEVAKFLALMRGKVILKARMLTLMNEALTVLNSEPQYRYTSGKVKKLLAIRRELLPLMCKGRRQQAAMNLTRLERRLRTVIDFYESKEEMVRRLRNYRNQHHLNQRQLAQRLGLTKAAVGQYEIGKRMPNSKHMQAIVSLLRPVVA
jgi:DNA-binding XRE family transcriptional regulator